MSDFEDKKAKDLAYSKQMKQDYIGRLLYEESLPAVDADYVISEIERSRHLALQEQLNIAEKRGKLYVASRIDSNVDANGNVFIERMNEYIPVQDYVKELRKELGLPPIKEIR